MQSGYRSGKVRHGRVEPGTAWSGLVRSGGVSWSKANGWVKLGSVPSCGVRLSRA